MLNYILKLTADQIKFNNLQKNYIKFLRKLKKILRKLKKILRKLKKILERKFQKKNFKKIYKFI